ncbi:lysozyme inhibitor LprI family protein [Paraburkholderia sp. SIMBA_027]|uniref:lysozyme inhibitor LprI family protein n=1 Tax=Paraburkholderia sp. SIMBA_027 TaxID=3085770 RepID=UPI00397AE862
MRLTKFLPVCVFGISTYMVVAPIADAATVYGASFDYRKAEPAIEQYPGMTPDQIKAHCKNENLGGMEMATCAQFSFEAANATLAKAVEENEKEIAKNDMEIRKNHNPVALPYFKRAQISWQNYRDNQCYANVYEIGEASIRFIDFYACMEKITNSRIDELSTPDARQ